MEEAEDQGQLPLLNFQRDILANAIERDGLFVLAPGLGVCQLVSALLKVQDERRKLSGETGVTLVIGADVPQREALQKELERVHPSKDRFAPEGEFPRHVTADLPTAERLKLYELSSCLFVTTRILVVDLLSGRLNPICVCGIIILNAHRVTDSSAEGFIVKLYRSKGGTGYVRAFSESPVSFTTEFAKAEKVLKALHLQNFQIWPRFRTAVQDDFEGKSPEVCICVVGEKNGCVLQHSHHAICICSW